MVDTADPVLRDELRKLERQFRRKDEGLPAGGKQGSDFVTRSEHESTDLSAHHLLSRTPHNHDAAAIAAVEGEQTLDLTGEVKIANNRGLVIGHTAKISTGVESELQVLGTDHADSSMVLGRWQDANTGARITLLASRNSTIGSNTIVQDGDELGSIRFRGDDGGDFITMAAEILVQVDGAPSANDMPGRLIFSTTADGASSVTERMRIDSSGQIGLGTASPNQRLTVEGTISLKEQADAGADTGDYGQVWVNTATPNELFFTNDAGTDTQLGAIASTTLAGKAELATAAETTTGTDTGRVVPVVALPVQIQDNKYTFVADTASDDDYLIAPSPAIAAYATGQMFHFTAQTKNTGAATLNVNGKGAKTIKKLHDQDLANDDIEAGQIVTVIYDGTVFQMQSQIAAAGGGGSSEWTDTGTLLHPADLSGAETVVVGGTTESNSDIILRKEGGAVFNEQGADEDFRVEGDTVTDAIKLDGETNSLHIHRIQSSSIWWMDGMMGA